MLFNLILNVGTEQVRSEFLVDPGIINITLSPTELSLIWVSDGLLSSWPMSLFHNEVPLKTKLFIEIPKTHLGGRSLLQFEPTLNLNRENKHIGRRYLRILKSSVTVRKI